MTARYKQLLLSGFCAVSALSLSACAGGDIIGHADPRPDTVLPTSQFTPQVETLVKPMNFRVNAAGLSENQRRALDQVAASAAWTRDAATDVEIVTSGDPAAIATGRNMAAYLSNHDVSDQDLRVRTAQDQAPDIVTVNLIHYRTKHLDCNQSWENVAATADNRAYVNFGCAVTANLAAQVADPRDLNHPATTTLTDETRKAYILDLYRKGQITSSAKDDQATGKVSDALQ